MNISAIDALLNASLDHVFPAAQLVVYKRGRIVYDQAVGWLDPDARSRPCNAETRFDLASVSKLFAAVAFMSFVEESRAQLDQPVGELPPEFDGERAIAPYPDPLRPGEWVTIWPESGVAQAGDVTFRHLLSHTSGLPAWLPLWRDAMRMSGWPERRQHYYNAITSASFACPIGARVVYSDLGLILLGFALERLAGEALDEIVRSRVTEPLGLHSVSYGPIGCHNVAPTEFYPWRSERMCGEVHDENACALGGVAGHAGLFGTARDVAAFGEALRQCLIGNSSVPLQQSTLMEIVRLQAQDGDVRRGLGFALWSPNERAMSHPLSSSAFGHLGFTGTSLWIDPERELVFACLTNHVYYGREGEDTMTPFRVALSKAIVSSPW